MKKEKKIKERRRFGKTKYEWSGKGEEAVRLFSDHVSGNADCQEKIFFCPAHSFNFWWVFFLVFSNVH